VDSKLLRAAFVVVVIVAGWAQCANAADGIADCPDSTDVSSKSRPYWKGDTLMAALLILQGKGEAKFHLEDAAPKNECVFEKFEVAGVAVEAIRSPYKKSAESIRTWRFRAEGAEPRDVLVLYDGTASMMANKEVFFVAEERKGGISYYAMFRDQPTFAVLKPMVMSILDGGASPLATVRWPPGAIEPVIDAYDTKRLK